MHRRCSQSLANLCSKSLLRPATHASLPPSLQQTPPGVFQTWSALSRFHQSGATTIGDESRAAGGFKGRPEAQARDYSFEGNRVPLKPWEQAAVAVGSAVGALMNPARADLVAALGETTGGPAFYLLLDRMKRSPEGRQILKDRPRVISSAVQHAWDMPENTFGAAYAKFMGSRNFSPDDRPPVRYLESEELAYVATRAREVHDFWHVLFNCPTTVTGELALKMVEFQQTLLPMCFLSVAGASWRLKPEQRAVLFGHYGPWAMRAGISADDLMCIYYEKHLHEDLAEVRRKWGIIPAPLRPKKKLS